MNMNQEKDSMAEPVNEPAPFPLAIPDDDLRSRVRDIWEARCNVRVWADPQRMEEATGCAATWRTDGHKRGTLACGPCGARGVVDRLSSYTLEEFTQVIGARTGCEAHAHVPT
jgi:hypothetical protein